MSASTHGQSVLGNSNIQLAVDEASAPSGSNIPFGLLELDPAGTVIRYSPAVEENSPMKSQDVLGRNLFNDIMPVEQMKNCQARFSSFMAHGESVHRFSVTFPFEHGTVKVQIMLARITEQSEHGRERLALVRIMPST